MVLQTTAPEADGQVVLFWLPDAGVKFAAMEARTTVANKPGRRGDHEAAVNHCAGNAGSFRCDRGDYARMLTFILHARLRVPQAPGIPRALIFGG